MAGTQPDRTGEISVAGRAADTDLSSDPDAPTIARDIDATVVWMAAPPLSPSRRVLIKHCGRTLPAIVRAIRGMPEVLRVTRTIAHHRADRLRDAAPDEEV